MQLEGSCASQRRLLQAEWDAAEAASQAHAIASEQSATLAQVAAAKRVVAQRQAHKAKLVREAATRAAEHAAEMSEAAARSHENVEAKVEPNENAAHEDAMAVLAARREATQRAAANVDEAARAHVAASAAANAAANALAAASRAATKVSEQPLWWFPSSQAQSHASGALGTRHPSVMSACMSATMSTAPAYYAPGVGGFEGGC